MIILLIFRHRNFDTETHGLDTDTAGHGTRQDTDTAGHGICIENGNFGIYVLEGQPSFFFTSYPSYRQQRQILVHASLDTPQ